MVDTHRNSTGGHNLELETDRLLLRPLLEADCDLALETFVQRATAGPLTESIPVPAWWYKVLGQMVEVHQELKMLVQEDQEENL